MRKWLGLAVAAVLLLAGAAIWLVSPTVVLGWISGETFHQGKPARYWRKAIIADDPVVRTEAESAIADGGENALAMLLELFQAPESSSWESAQLRWKIVELIGEMGQDAKKAIPDVIAAMKDSDPHVRSVAAGVLPEIGATADQAIPPLLELLEREQTVSVIRALSAYREQAAPSLEPLSKILQDKERDSEIRWNAARTLGKLGKAGAPSIPTLIDHLEDPSDTVREHSAEALGDIGPVDASVVPALISVLNDPYVRVRRDAVRSLGYLGPMAKEAVPAIQPLLKDKEAIVRDAAKTALKSIES